MSKSFLSTRVRISRKVLLGLGVLCLLVYVVAQLDQTLIPAWIKWVALGAALTALGMGVSSGGSGVPPFRTVQFFNTTDTRVKKVHIEAKDPVQPPPPAPGPDLADIAPGGLVVHEAPAGDSFYQGVKRLSVTIVLVDPADPTGRGIRAAFDVDQAALQGSVGMGVLAIAVAGETGTYNGSACAVYAEDEAGPWQSTSTVAFVFPTPPPPPGG